MKKWFKEIEQTFLIIIIISIIFILFSSTIFFTGLGDGFGRDVSRPDWQEQVFDRAGN